MILIRINITPAGMANRRSTGCLEQCNLWGVPNTSSFPLALSAKLGQASMRFYYPYVDAYTETQLYIAPVEQNLLCWECFTKKYFRWLPKLQPVHLITFRNRNLTLPEISASSAMGACHPLSAFRSFQFSEPSFIVLSPASTPDRHLSNTFHRHHQNPAQEKGKARSPQPPLSILIRNTTLVGILGHPFSKSDTIGTSSSIRIPYKAN